MTGDVYTTESDKSSERGDEGELLKDEAVTESITAETISRIMEFATKHSDGIEEADNLGNALHDVLFEIISYCRKVTQGKLLIKKEGSVEVNVVPTIEECLRVSIKTPDGETRDRFDNGMLKCEIEEKFVRLLDCRANAEREG